MHELILQSVTLEVAAALQGGTWGRIWQLGRASFVCEIRKESAPFLFIGVEPQQPRLYLVSRKVRELEREMRPPQGFALTLRRQLAGANLIEVSKDASDRIVRFHFNSRDELGVRQLRQVIVQLTGRASNLLLLDGKGIILDTLRPLTGEGQELGMQYHPPAKQPARQVSEPPFAQGAFATLSEAADNYYTILEAENAQVVRLKNIRQKLRTEISYKEKQLARLDRDLTAHGIPLEHKYKGDLLLANLNTAVRVGDTVSLTDYFAHDAPKTTILVEETLTLTEAAQKFFARYAKAKRAAIEVERRKTLLLAELDELQQKLLNVDNESAPNLEQSVSALQDSLPKKQPGGEKKSELAKCARQYLSSDGLQIFVGRAAKDNDYLTFRWAKPNDWWLHAADYPGSHVIIRNPGRGEIPQRTLIEAAQLAAQYSQGKNQPKADVRYTQRKLLSKPKGAAPGLVRLSHFRTILVTPAESGKKV